MRQGRWVKATGEQGLQYTTRTTQKHKRHTTPQNTPKSDEPTGAERPRGMPMDARSISCRKHTRYNLRGPTPEGTQANHHTNVPAHQATAARTTPLPYFPTF